MSKQTEFSDEREIIKFLTNDLVVRIFVTLCAEPMNTRGLSRILGVHETIVSKKLKFMEKLGLVRSKWVRIKDKNVKLYYPRASSYSISVGPRGIEIVYGSRELDIPYTPKTQGRQQNIFVGREKELSFLRDNSRKFILVVGLPGVGKTSLVAKYARESGYRIIWIDILETTTLQGVMRSIAFSVDEDSRKNIINIIKSSYGDPAVYIDAIMDLVSSREVLLVLDNFHLNADPGIELLVKKLALAENLKGKVIVISRSLPGFYVSEEKILYVKPFSLEESLEFLQSHGFSRENAIRIHKVFNGHPYMLVLFVREYSRDPSIIDRIESLSKNYLIYEILDNLSYDDKSVLNLICVLRKTAPIRLLKKVSVEPRRVKKSIEKLLMNLILVRLPSGFQIAEVVKDFYCRDVIDSESYHYIAARYYSSSDNDEDLLEALYHYAESGRYNESINVLPKIGSMVMDNEVVLESFIKAIEEIRENSTDNLVKAWASFIQAKYLILKGVLDKALKLLNWAETIGFNRSDYRLVLYSKIEKSLIYRYYSDYDRAVKELKKAKKILDHVKIRGREDIKVKIYMALAPIYYFQGRVSKALRIFRLLMDKYIDPLDGFKNALVNGWLGLVYRFLGRYGDSVDSLEEAIKVFSKLNYRHSLAIAYRELSLTYFSSARLDSALDSIVKAIELLEGIGVGKHPITLAGAYIDYSIYSSITGRIDNARKALDKAVKLMKEYRIETLEHKLLQKLAETLLAYREDDLGLVEKNLLEIIDLVDKASIYRQLYTLTITTPITCKAYGKQHTLCIKSREKLENIIEKLSRGKADIEKIHESLNRITNIITRT